MPIKIQTYQALVLSTLLYAAETWNLHDEDVRKVPLEVTASDTVLRIRWQDHVRNVKVANQTALLQSWNMLFIIATPLSVTLPGCCMPS